MKRLDADGLLAIHLHRNADGSWYAIGTFADKTIGKRGHKKLSNHISQTRVESIACLIETADSPPDEDADRLTLLIQDALDVAPQEPGKG